jgi:hypothetical protein
MTLRRTRAENLALTMLARDGIAAIWLLHLSAARVYREGHKAAAAGIIEIAEAAEREWLRRGETLRASGLAALAGLIRMRPCRSLDTAPAQVR